MSHVIFLKNKGCKLDEELYQMLLKDWAEVHGNKKHIRFNMKKDRFFNKNVERKYNHDWLHEFLAFRDKAWHNYIRPDSESAYCSERLWNGLTLDEKIECALEEIYVIATERFVLPDGIPPKIAKQKALKKLITGMSKGWFNLFLIENFERLIKFNDENWINKLKELKDE